MKTIVIYKSRTGFAKKYAEWIAQDLSADIFDASEVTAGMLDDYDAVVYGGGLHAVGINGISLIKNNIGKLKGKKVAVFATGASPFREEVLQGVKDANFSPEDQKGIGFFYLRGGFDFKKLGFSDKAMMTVMKWILKSKKELTEDEKGLLSAYDVPVDFTDRENIKGLVSYISS